MWIHFGLKGVCIELDQWYIEPHNLEKHLISLKSFPWGINAKE